MSTWLNIQPRTWKGTKSTNSKSCRCIVTVTKHKRDAQATPRQNAKWTKPKQLKKHHVAMLPVLFVTLPPNNIHKITHRPNIWPFSVTKHWFFQLALLNGYLDRMHSRNLARSHAKWCLLNSHENAPINTFREPGDQRSSTQNKSTLCVGDHSRIKEIGYRPRKRYTLLRYLITICERAYWTTKTLCCDAQWTLG